MCFYKAPLFSVFFKTFYGLGQNAFFSVLIYKHFITNLFLVIPYCGYISELPKVTQKAVVDNVIHLIV